VLSSPSGERPSDGSDMGRANEPPPRIVTTTRSPSAERTAGVSGTILPVVEEVGEGSNSGRSRNGSARSMNYSDAGRPDRYVDGAPMQKNDSGLGQRDTPDSSDSGRERHLNLTHKLAVRRDAEDLAIRVARVDG
jgi:1-phosphatidylinositol-4-phosphate 5-kinase